MALCPFAIQKLITIDTAGRAHTPVRMTEHTAVSSAVDLYKGKPAPNGTYAHFYVNEAGTIYQYRDTALAARADGQGNFGSISVETWDGAREQAWNAKQVASLARLFAWAMSVHPTIPYRLATVNDLRGLAWHRLGCKGNFGAYNANDITTWSGNQSGASWSTAFGKTCPYNVRIRQIPGILAASNKSNTASEEDVMNKDQEKKLDGAIAALTSLTTSMSKVVQPTLSRLDIGRYESAQKISAIQGQIAGLSEAVTQLQGGQQIDMAAVIKASSEAAEKGAREGAAAVGAEDVAERLEIKTKSN